MDLWYNNKGKRTISSPYDKGNKASCLHVRDVSFIIAEPESGSPPPHMSIFSLGKGEKEHEVFKCEYVGRGSKAGLEYAGWRLESDFSEMKWRKQF